jgi:competence protein ComEC
MLAGMPSLIAGLALPSLLPFWPGVVTALAAFVVALLCLPCRGLRRLIPFFLGFALSLVRIQADLDARLPGDCEGRDMTIIGHVVGLPDIREGYRRFRFDVANASIEACYVDRIELRAYQPLEVRGDEWWRFVVRLRRVHGFSNPGGFDFEGDRWRRGIYASGYVRRSKANTLLLASWGLHAARTHLRKALVEHLPDTPAAGMVRALAIGDRDDLGAEYWDALNRTGTTHLAVISGLHVGMVAMVTFALALGLLRALGPGLAGVSAPALASVPALLSATAYASLAGFSLPTQRALVMVAVGLYCVANARRIAPATGIVTALVFVLLLDPLAPAASSFWLSFAAVAALVFFFSQRVHPNVGRSIGIVQRTLWAQLVVFVALLAPLLVFTRQSALVSPLANLLGIPLVGFLVVPLTLLGTLCLDVLPTLADVLLDCSERLVTGLFEVLAWLAEHAPVLSAAMFTTAGIVGLSAGCALLLMPRGTRGRWLWMLAPLVMAVQEHASPGQHHVRITVLDVGQGLSVLVQTRGHALLYDAGARFGPGIDAGQLVVIPALRALGVAALDTMIVSHADNDHAGGAQSVVEVLPVSRIFVGSPATRDSIGRSAELCGSGRRWTWDGVEFRLHQQVTAASENDLSCVLWVTFAGGSALLPGDITVATERRLREPKPVELLVAPHHGSRSSSAPEFVDILAPTHVIFSAGYRNSYGHPDPAVVQRYRDAGSHLHGTSEGGALMWDSSSPRAVVSWRSQSRRYWNW